MRTSLAIAVFFFALRSAAQPLDPVRLAWKYQPGSSRIQRQVNDTELRQTTPQGESATRTRLSSSVRLAVLDAAAGGGTIESECRSLTMTYASPAGEQHYDSAHDPPPTHPVLRSAAILLGKKIRYHVAADGRVSQVEGLEELFKDAPGANDAAVAALAATLKSTYEQCLPPLPQRPVSPGESWERKSAIPLAGGLHMTLLTGCVYEGQEEFGGEACARLGLDFGIEMAAAPGGPPTRARMLKSSGPCLIALERGVCVRLALDLDYAIEYGPPGGPPATRRIHQITRQEELEHTR
ncbi:MAG: hypothetical protein HZA54_17640 [Planctomycetes bacterium]|nr:hypothetical protein [Planctomycetota bacterium]